MTYRERLYAPPLWWAAGMLFAAVWGWLLWVATSVLIALVATAAVAVLMAALLIGYGRLLVIVDGNELRIGGAHIEARFLRAPEALDADALRVAMGPGANALAFIRTRPYIRTGVRVALDDRRDPAPYWLVSTRRPVALVESIEAAMVQTGDRNAEREGTCGKEG